MNQFVKKIIKKGFRLAGIDIHRYSPHIHDYKYSRYRIDRDFFSDYSEERAKRLFTENVQYIVFETHSFCNRTCWFCPNSSIDRHSGMKYMEDALYRKILHELAELDFKGDIAFGGYNESLADKDFPARVKLAREFLPDALMHINSNGDYLTSEILHELYDAGLTRLCISVYVDSDKPDSFTYSKGMEAVLAMNEKLGLSAKITTQPNDVYCEAIIRYGKTSSRKGLYVVLNAANHNLTTNYRGGALPDTVPVPKISSRDKMCISPFTEIAIYYDGLVTPCANFRPDFPGHVSLITGDCKQNTVYEIFAGAASTEFRKALIQNINMPPCNRCTDQWENHFFIEREDV